MFENILPDPFGRKAAPVTEIYFTVVSAKDFSRMHLKSLFKRGKMKIFNILCRMSQFFHLS